jgi:peptidoglycan/LPS O-acetylase OafA/YrhL
MVVGSLAGVALFYELVLLAHRGQLETRMHDPANVMLGAACFFVFGWGLALVAPRTARWLGMFTAAGAAAAGAIAASGTETAYAVPLFCVGLAAAIVVFASFRGEKQERKARTA